MTAPPAAQRSVPRLRRDPAGSRAPLRPWPGMRDALHAEWTKLRTTPGGGWLALIATTLIVGLGAAAAAAVTYSPGTNQDPAKISLTGLKLGQAVIAILAVLAISSEYDTRMIRTTLTAMPRRTTMLAAKATVVTAVALAAGTLAVLASVLAGRLLLPSNGFTPAHGYPPLSLADGPTLRAAAGSALYLVLIALLCLGIATTLRESATAMGAVLALLYLFPIIAAAVTNPHWQRHLQQISPMPAGLAIQSTTNLHNLPISPWAGLGVLAAWAAAAMLTGALTLRLRDA
jgi:ABC-2 type transport system permease protein